MRVEVVCGWFRDHLVTRIAGTRHLAALGALEVACIECDGMGKFFGHPECDELPCNVCKNDRGRVFVGG